MLRFDAIPVSVHQLLMRLAASPALAAFMLGGGTSLALRFGHRLSVDLDFFTLNTFDPDELIADLDLHDATSTARAASSLTLDVGGVKLDLLRHAYPMLDAPEEMEGVRLLSVPDVTAMKLNAIANRGAKKDFHDIAMLLSDHSLEKMLGWFEAKYRNADRFTVIRSLGWFEDAEREPNPVSLLNAEWEGIKKVILSEVAKLC
jgi:predicted nucleotidyltransferase component of viral defense system